MPSDSSDRKSAARAQAAAIFGGATPPPPPPQSENLPCPRCDSTNTKFCYYNNYNLSQPRHFCKSCRRYWTQGGTLRNVPVGGGTRKNSKRSRSANTATTSITSSSSVCSNNATMNLESTNVNNSSSLNKVSESECHHVGTVGNGSFTSLLSSQGGGGVHGFLGFEEMGFGFAEKSWPYQDMNHCNATTAHDDFGYSGNVSAVVGDDSSAGNAWQMSGGVEQGSLLDGDCFAWPDLAISTTGKMG